MLLLLWFCTAMAAVIVVAFVCHNTAVLGVCCDRSVYLMSFAVESLGPMFD